MGSGANERQILPAGIYHRFTTDSKNVSLRLWRVESVGW
jgi:cupin superfamily acireductone dioxygenase involved in methionine salvage